MANDAERKRLHPDHQEHLGRLRAMVQDRGETWDLSDNDQKAIAYALELIGKNAVAEVQSPEAPRPHKTPDLVIEIARELYDRFVMGGWEPQDAYPQIERWLGLTSAESELRSLIGELAQSNANLIAAFKDAVKQCDTYFDDWAEVVETATALLAKAKEVAHGN